VPLFGQILLYIALLLFSLGLLFIHLRLRTKASLVLIISFSSLVSWVSLSEWVFGKYVELTTEPIPAGLTNAEIFNRMAIEPRFDLVFAYGAFTFLTIFCAAFLLSALSMPRLTTQSRGPPWKH